jgi:uncharacterized protein involved in outer membrane biogenesis
MKKRRIIFSLVAVLGLPGILLACLFLYLALADLSGWGDRLAEKLTKSLGREVQIGGDLQLHMGAVTRLVARDIRIANPDWCSDDSLLSVQRLAVELDLLSLAFGPITISDIRITGTRVLLESRADGPPNWAFDTAKKQDKGNEKLDFVLKHLQVDGLDLVYRSPTRVDLVELTIERLEGKIGEAGMIDLDMRGNMSETPVDVSGRLGTLMGIVNTDSAVFDLQAGIADAHLSLALQIDDLATLTGTRGSVSTEGPDIAHLFGQTALDPELAGPFSFKASTRPSPSGIDIELHAAVVGSSLRVSGSVDSLVDPGKVDVRVESEGEDVARVGRLAGFEKLPQEDFSLSGRLVFQGFPISFQDVKAQVGANTLTVDGVLGQPPQMLDTDFLIDGEGPDLSALASLAGIELPAQDYEIQGRLFRVEGGLRADGVTARVGPTRISVDGTMGDPPNYSGTALTIVGHGPDLAQFQDLAGISLPSEPFNLEGRLREAKEAIEIDSFYGQLGKSSVELLGRISTDTAFVGTDLRLSARGPDASDLATLAKINTLPAEAWTLEAELAVLQSGIELQRVSASIGSLDMRGHASFDTGAHPADPRLHIRLEDPDLGHLTSIAGYSDLPAKAVGLEGILHLGESGYRLEGLQGSVGGVAVEASGVITRTQKLHGSELQMAFRGSRLSDLSPFLDLKGLPEAPFAVAGTMRLEDAIFGFEGLTAKVADTILTAAGVLDPEPGLVGTQVTFDLHSPDLASTGSLAAGLGDLPELPRGPFSLSGQMLIDEAGYKLEDIEARLADASARIDGRIGLWPDLVGTDIDVSGKGPDGSVFNPLVDAEIPAEAFELGGTFQRGEDGFRFHDLSIRLGQYLAEIDGNVGEPPQLVGTSVELRASGPDIGLMGDLLAVSDLPPESFSLKGRFQGTPEHFTADDLEIRIGQSDLGGWFNVDIRNKPAITVRASSRFLTLRPLAHYLAQQEAEEEDPDPATTGQPGEPVRELMFSPEPIRFEHLERANADIELTIDKLELPAKRFSDVTLQARLTDGRLDVHRLAVTDQRQGRGSGSLVLEPTGDDAYHLSTVLDLDALRLDLPGDAQVDPASWPSIDIDLRLEARGRSPRDFVDSADGFLQIVVGKGLMDNRLLDFVTTDIALELLNAFNPFAQEDETTELQCGVALLTVKDSLATLKPMALQSEKMTMLGSGQINLESEELDFDWVTKPRKGIGLSASMITNPYIRLGGTLSEPRIELNDLEAVRSTGFAVATLGASLVAGGLLDRITAEKKVCKEALTQIGRPPKTRTWRFWKKR